MEQTKYHSIVRLGHKSTVDVLNIGDYIVIQEKIDGANASFRKDGDVVRAYSRNKELNEENTLGGFYQWVQENVKAEDLHEDAIYFGEWLNPHKVKYPDYEKQFFLYDIYDTETERYIGFRLVELQAEKLGLNLVPVFYDGEYQSFEHLESFVGKTALGGMLGDKQTGEGIVVKNVNYEDRFGRQLFVKLVVDDFREVQKQKKYKNPNEALTPEAILAHEVITQPRIEKLIYKFKDEGLISANIEKKDIGFIFKNVNTYVWEDVLKEESDQITEDMDLKVLRSMVSKQSTKNTKLVLMEMGVL